MTLSFRHTGIIAATLATLVLPTAAQDLHAFQDSSRLVSIGGSLTEIIYALGEEDRLVARDQTALYPAAAAALPDVGYMRRLAPEGVLSVGPTALLVVEGSGPPEALEVLGDAGALASELDAALKAVQARTADLTDRKRVLFVLSVEGGKIQASGTDTAANGIIELAGALNAVTEYPGYKALTEEAIIAAAPDVILMMERGEDHSAIDADLFGNPAIALTPAGRDHAIIRLEGSYLLGFGPRAPQAVTDLVDALYGE